MSDDLDKRNLKNPKNMTAAQARKVAQELRESTYQYNVKLPDGETENGETKYRTITRLKPLAGEMSPTMRSQMQNKYPNLYKPNQPSVAPMRTELQEVSKAQQIGAMSVMSRKISELQKPVKELEKQIEVNRQKGLPNLVAKQESDLRRLKENTDFQIKLLRNTQPQAQTPVSGSVQTRPDSLLPQQTAPQTPSIPITQPTGVTRPYDEQVDLGQVDKPVEFQPEGIKLENMSKEQQEFVKSMGSIDKLESVAAQAKALDIKFEDMPKIQRAFEESAYASLSMGTYQPYTKMEKQADGTSKLTQDTKALEEQTTGEVFASVLGSFAGSVPMLQIGGVVSGKMLAGTLARIGPFLPKAISKPVYDVAGKVVSYAFDSKIGQRLLSGLGFGFFWGVRPAVSGVLQKKPAGQVVKETASSFGWGFLMGTALPGMRAVTQPLVDKKFIPEALKLPLSRALAAGSVTFPLELGRGKLEQTIAKNVREKQEQGEDVSTYLVERTDSQILQDAIVETMIDMVMDGFEGIDAKNVQVAMPENLQQELQFRDDLGKLGFQEHTDVDINGQTVGTGIMLKNDPEQGILAVRLPFANAEYKNRVDYQSELGNKIAPETPPQIQPEVTSEVTPEVASTRPNELDIASVKAETPPVDNTVVPEPVPVPNATVPAEPIPVPTDVPAQPVPAKTPTEGAVSVPRKPKTLKNIEDDYVVGDKFYDKVEKINYEVISKDGDKFILRSSSMGDEGINFTKEDIDSFLNPAKAGAISVPENDMLSRIKPEDRITSYQDLKDKISTVSPNTIKQEESEVLFALIEGAAAYRGLSPDDYVRERIVGFESTNRGTKTLAQTKYIDDARVVLKAFKNNDVVSMAHELGHVFRRDLDAPDLKVAEDWVGVKDGKWTDAHEEKFAEGFTTYLEEGKAPNKGLRGVFEKFKKWATEIYKNLRSKKSVELSDEIRGVFDRVVSGRKVEVSGKEVTPVTPKITGSPKVTKPSDGAVAKAEPKVTIAEKVNATPAELDTVQTDLGSFLDGKNKSLQTRIKNQLTGEVSRHKLPNDKIITGTKKDFIEALNPSIVKAEIKEGTGTVKINEYRLYDSDNSWYKVSKAEFDYYNYLQDKPVTPKVTPAQGAVSVPETPKVTIAEQVTKATETYSPELESVATDYGFSNAREAELAILAREGTAKEFQSKLGKVSASEAKTYRAELSEKIGKMSDEDIIGMKDEIQILNSTAEKKLTKAERTERKKLLGQIVKLSKSSLRPDYEKQRNDLLEAIDVGYKGMKSKKVAELTAIKDRLIQDPDFYVPQREMAQLERLSKTPLSKMDTDDMKDIVNILKSIEHISKTEDQIIGQAQKQSISDVRDYVGKKIKSTKGALAAIRGLVVGTPSKIKKGKIPSLWGDETYTPTLLANTIEGVNGPINDLTFKAFDKGTTVRLANEQKLSKMWQEAQGKQDLSKWSRQSDKPEFVKTKIPEVTISSKDGDETFTDYELALTPFERGRIWFEYTNRGEYLDDMISAGFRINDEVLETRVIKFANGIDDVKRIADSATKIEKDIATMMSEHFKTDGKKDIDDITMQLWGRHITLDKYGMPIQRSSLDYDPYTKTGLVPGSSIRVLEKTGLLRERTGKNMPVLLEGLDETWSNYINEVSALKGYAIPVRNLKKTIRDKGMQAVFKGAGQEKKIALLERYLQDMEGILENPLETKSVFQRLFRNLSSSAVVANIGTSMIQLPSIFYSMPDIGWKYMSSIKAQPNFAEMREHSPQAFDRLQGHMEADFGIDTNKSRKYTMLGWKGSVYDKVFTEYLSKSLRSPDAWVVGNIFEMVKSKVSAEQPNLKGDAYWSEVDRQWTDTVNRRQPTSYAHARSATGRSKDMFVKSYTLFTTQLNNAKAMLIEGALDVSRDGNVKLGMSKIITVVLGIGMLKTFRDRFMAKLKGDSPTYEKGEEPTKAKQAADFLAEVLVNTLAVDYVSNKVVGMMYRKMKYGTFGYDITDIISDSINDFATGAVQLMQAGSQYINDERYDQGNKLYGYKKDDPKWDRTFWKGVKNTTYPILHGMRIPARNIETNWEIIDRMFKEQDN